MNEVDNSVELAVLKTKFDNLAKVVEDHMEREEADRMVLMEILTKQSEALDSLEDSLGKYKSFVGGIIWTITALSAAAVTVWEFVYSYSFRLGL